MNGLYVLGRVLIIVKEGSDFSSFRNQVDFNLVCR